MSIALYSINLRIMGGPNKPLIGADTVFTVIPNFGLPAYVIDPIALAAIVIC